MSNFTMDDFGNDTIDVRDLTEAYDELAGLGLDLDEMDPDDQDLFKAIEAALNSLKGEGDDVKWRGHWYPALLIRYDYFIEYAQDMAAELGLTDDELRWPYTHIDWEQAARELRADYSEVDINTPHDSFDYLYR